MNKHEDLRITIKECVPPAIKQELLEYVSEMEKLEMTTLPNLKIVLEDCKNAYEELRRDIKRYFELDEKLHVDRLTILEAQEKCELAVELSKVCEEE